MTNQQGAPEALPDPSPDQLRAIARTARNSSGSASDDCGPLAYVLHGWRAAAIALRAQQAALVEAQQPAPSAAGVGNSGFDYQTAADFLNGKTVSDEAMRKFVAASRWAHDDRVGLRATLLSVRGELASREAEIALLKKAQMDAEAPQPSPTPQADSQPAPQKEYPTLPEPSTTGLGDEYEAFDRNGKAMGKAYETILYFNADQMRAYVDADRAARAPGSQPAPAAAAAFEVADAMADSQYLAGVSAGWNAANADDPNAALQKLHESRAGYLKPLSAARAPADSVTAPAGGATSKNLLQVRAWVIPDGNGGGQFSWQKQDERFWIRLTPPAQAADSVLEDADPIRALIAQHAAILDQNELAYFELCYHRVTGWMAWITDKPLCMPPVISPDRKVLAQGQGDTADEACRDAARKQGANHDNA